MLLPVYHTHAQFLKGFGCTLLPDCRNTAHGPYSLLLHREVLPVFRVVFPAKISMHGNHPPQGMIKIPGCVDINTGFSDCFKETIVRSCKHLALPATVSF